MVAPHLTLPDYWLPQPPFPFGAQEQRACDAFFAAALAHGAATPIAYSLAIPKWRFLCYIVEQHDVVLHGSSNADIARFEPRQSLDLNDFGAQTAVYAAADGIWPLYFAIVDRAKSPTLHNACVRVERPNGTLDAPYYYFSISRQALAHQAAGDSPYHNGTVYLLPRATFVAEPSFLFGTWRIHTAQLASPVAVTPLAKLTITPEDFPFLAQMQTHDDARLAEYTEAMRQGLPMPEA